MTNSGPSTNRSQAFISTVRTPHLDDTRVAFGEVLKGKSVARQIENHPTGSGDEPTEPIVIVACGELQPDDPSLAPDAAGADGDPYEDYPDEEDARDVQGYNKVALDAATRIREIGNKLFKEGKVDKALERWQKSTRNVDLHFKSLGTRGNHRACICRTAGVQFETGECGVEQQRSSRESELSSSRISLVATRTTRRRSLAASAYALLEQGKEAEKNLTRAASLVLNDRAILGELDKVQGRQKEKEKKACK